MEIFIIALVILILVIFIIYPLVLLIQSLFDSNVSAGTKILIVLSTLFVFPIPSFCYGAFVRDSGLSKFILAIYVIIFVLAIAFVTFFGGAAFVAAYLEQSGIDIGQIVETQTMPAIEAEPEPVYKGYNTYGADEVNVFESSGPDDEPLPVETAPAPEAPAQEQPQEQP